MGEIADIISLLSRRETLAKVTQGTVDAHTRRECGRERIADIQLLALNGGGRLLRGYWLVPWPAARADVPPH